MSHWNVKEGMKSHMVEKWTGNREEWKVRWRCKKPDRNERCRNLEVGINERGEEVEQTCAYGEEDRVCEWQEVWVPVEGMIGIWDERGWKR